MRLALGFLLVLLVPMAAAQMPESRITLTASLPPDSDTAAGNTTALTLQVAVDFAGVYCIGPSAIDVGLSYSGLPTDPAIQVNGLDILRIPFGTGPVAGSPAGPPPGLASSGQANATVYIVTGPAAKNATFTLTVVATVPGTMPGGCEGAPGDAAEASAEHTARVQEKPPRPSPPTPTAVEAGADNGKEAPVPPWPVLIVALGAAVAARQRL